MGSSYSPTPRGPRTNSKWTSRAARVWKKEHREQVGKTQSGRRLFFLITPSSVWFGRKRRAAPCCVSITRAAASKGHVTSCAKSAILSAGKAKRYAHRGLQLRKDEPKLWRLGNAPNEGGQWDDPVLGPTGVGVAFNGHPAYIYIYMHYISPRTGVFNGHPLLVGCPGIVSHVSYTS